MIPFMAHARRAGQTAATLAWGLAPVCLAFSASVASAAPPPLTEDEAYAIGVEAYTYAYPMVLMEVSRRITTNVAQPDGAKLRAPVNQFTHASTYPDAKFKDVVRPNADTLYSICLLYTSPSPRDRTRSRMPSSA